MPNPDPELKVTVTIPTSQSTDASDVALDLYLNQYCNPITESHVLPKSKTSSMHSPCGVLRRNLKPCVIIQKFSVGRAMANSQLFGLTTVRPQLEDKLSVDILAVSPVIGVALFFHRPKNEDESRWWERKKRDLEATCGWLNAILKDIAVSAWLITRSNDSFEGKKLNLATTPEDCTLPDPFKEELHLLHTEPSYIATLKTIVCVWSGMELPRPTTGLESIIGSKDKLSGEKSFVSVDDFREDCVKTMNAAYPGWLEGMDCTSGRFDRPFMIPEMFPSKSPEPLKQGCAEAIYPGINIKRGEHAERLVYEALELVTRDNNYRCFVFHGLTLRRVVQERHKLPVDFLPSDVDDVEIDFVIVSPHYGIVLLEVKAAEALTHDTVSETIGQLRRDERVFQHLCYTAKITNFEGSYTKVAVFPFSLPNDVDRFMNERRRIEDKTSVNRLEGLRTQKRVATSDNIYRDVFLISGVAPHVALKNVLRGNSSQGSGAMANVTTAETTMLYAALTPILARIHRLNAMYSTSITQNALYLDQYKVVKEDKQLKSDLERTGSSADAKRAQKRGSHPAIDNDHPPTAAFRDRNYSFENVAVNIYFLTPEQMDAWEGPPYQVITGRAGSGKTIVLTARLRHLLLDACNVLVVARPAANLYYKVFAKTIGLTGGSFLVEPDIRNAFPQFTRVIDGLTIHESPQAVLRGTQFDADEELAEPKMSNSATQMMKDALAADMERLSGGLTVEAGCSNPPWYILIDDAVPTEGRGRTGWSRGTLTVHEICLIHLLNARIEPIASVWLAYDPTLPFPRDHNPEGLTYDDADNLSDEQLLDKRDASFLNDIKGGKTRLEFESDVHLLQHIHCECKALSSTLRNCSSVARFVYNKGVWPDTDVETRHTETLNVGHNFNGIVPRIFNLEDHTIRMDVRAGEIILEQIEELLPKRPDGTIPWRHVVVLFRNETRMLDGANMKDAMLKEMLRSHVPTGTIEEQIFAKGRDEDILAIDDVDQTYSLEWTLVFYVRPEGMPQTSEGDDHTDYMGRTRAVAALIELIIGSP